MARGGKVSYKRKTRNKVRLEKKGSDESDEDYRVDEDEEFHLSEDDYCSSLAENESDESVGKFDDEEEEWIEKKVKTKKIGKPKGRKSFQTRKKNMVVKSRKKQVSDSEEEEEEEEEYDDYCVSSVRQQKKSEEEEEDYDDEDDDIRFFRREDEDDFVDENPSKKSRVSRTEMYEDSYNEESKEIDKLAFSEENEDDDYNDSDDSDDEEFAPVEVLKCNSRKPVRRRVLRTKNRSNPSKEFKDKNTASRKRKAIKEWGWGRRKKATVTVNSDSDIDIVSSESSDYEYTISEEEREQIKEATQFCKRSNTNLRSSNSLKMTEEEKLVPIKGKRPGRKGKQKVVDLTIEIVKQVCGICLSEEGKHTVKGVLNCCSHYFCFACIMEWSKVESRCPLCKQRFATISRTARTDGGNDLRDAVFPVPERDQVYQPSEEELRGYLDPYENVLCTECLQGGDDAFMLLCDLCDSPAHTYCVGLGREVPDGNWYCDGCRPTALASSNAQVLNSTPDHGPSNNLSVGSSPGCAVRETFDLNEAYVPDTPLSHVSGHSQSPRHAIGHLQPTSPASGSGAFTLHDRRRIQQVIHRFRSRQAEGNNGVASASAINTFGSQIGRGVIATQNTIMPRMASQNIFRGRLADYSTSSLCNRDSFSPRLSNLRGGVLQSQPSTSNAHPFGGLSQSEYAGINARIGGDLVQQQLHHCSTTSNTGADASTPPFQFTEATVPSRTLQGSLHTRF
ncbi:chromodomain-helicase-DNA-binding protein 4-like [Salvia splendens]|uniref:chromodomain-helicase-DNA-binding protein 4-like n=1 Tax=Salvia splendens TaxID=180675 RepID=UPI001C2584B6|nr:chromodomain-helicase-DNA-binding protein 4-like [Salvia splendens]XP_042049723.1 chromodomain-helicase-DNA-binding protein 4-like [Salvia splendens]